MAAPTCWARVWGRKGSPLAERPLWIVQLGRVPYDEALALQRALVRAKKEKRLEEDLLLLLEHPPVITLGRRGEEANVLAPPDLLHARGIAVHRVERGGDVTYHGPGQLVGYPIVSLRHLPTRRDVGRFVWTLQEALIQLLASYGVRGERIDRVIGVWVRGTPPPVPALESDPERRATLQRLVGDFEERKIAAIGARIEGWVSYHGFALNVTTDLTDFGLIVPCGLEDRGVTSMAAEIGRDLSLTEVGDQLAERLAALWQFTPLPRDADEIRRLAAPFVASP